MRRVLVLAVRGLLVAALVGLVLAGAWIGYLLATAPEPRAMAGWDQWASLPEARGEVTAAVGERPGGHRLAVIGGFTGLAGTTAAVTFYDLERAIWTTGPSLPEPRHHTAAASLDGRIYVAGGAASAWDWEPRTDAWVLEPESAGWARIDPLPEGRYGHRLVAHDGRLYSIGGAGGAAVLVYEPGSGWSPGADLPQPRDHLGAVLVDGEIWAIGGRDADGLTARVDIYDPATDTWREGPPLPEPVSAAVVGVVQGHVIVAGGEDPATVGGEVFDRSWRLAVPDGAWEDGPLMPLPVHGAADAVIGDELYVAGGASRQGSLSVLSWTDRVEVLTDPMAAPR